MKLGKMVYGLLVAAWMLCGCHTPLYRAAERGDTEAVRHMLAAGADAQAGASGWNKLWQYPAELVVFPLDVLFVLVTAGQMDAPLLSDRIESFGEKTPAEAAWQRGHTEVVALLAGGGAAVAADSLAGRTLLLQEDVRWEEAYVRMGAGDVAKAHVADCFVRYWEEDVDWQKNRGMRLLRLSWASSGAPEAVRHYAVRQYSAVVPEQLVYRRTGVKSAEITLRGRIPGQVAAKYELVFEDAAYGKYRCLSLRTDGMLNQYSGRFWVRNIF